MKRLMLKALMLSLFAVGSQAAGAAQEATSRTQEQLARTLEATAKNQETAARLAEESAVSDPDSEATLRDAAKRARDAANRAQDAANRAQDAADKDPASSEAQTAALRAQEAANRALESSNRAREAVNRARKVRPASGEGVRTSAAPNPATGAEPSPGGATASVSVTPPAVGVPSGAASDTNGGASAGTNGATPVTASAPPPAAGPTRPAQGSTPSKPALSTEATDYSNFINARIEEVVRTSLGPKNDINQSEAPSVSTGSTSLVEKSSVSDLIGFAFNPAGTAGGSGTGDATSTSISVSAYALKAFLSSTDPLDPAFYTSNRRWRKFSFTYGYDFPEGEEGNPRERGNIYGIKFVPYDKRDVSHPSNRAAITAVSQGLQSSGVAAANVVADVRRYIFNRLRDSNTLPASVTAITTGERDQRLEFDNFLADKGYEGLLTLIGEEGIKEIDTIIARRTEFVEFDRTVEDTINRIRRRPQVSMFFLTKQRRDLRPDDYNGGLSLDLGVAERWNLTFNGTFNFTDNKLEEDNRGGEFGTELMIPLTAINRLSDRAPATFTFAASGEWKTSVAPMYQAQAKLKIPVPFLPGLEMPISVSFASRTELINESDVRGRIGFTFDVARLLTELRSKFLARVPLPTR
jgi:hypothetical protein